MAVAVVTVAVVTVAVVTVAVVTVAVVAVAVVTVAVVTVAVVTVAVAAVAAAAEAEPVSPRWGGAGVDLRWIRRVGGGEEINRLGWLGVLRTTGIDEEKGRFSDGI